MRCHLNRSCSDRNARLPRDGHEVCNRIYSCNRYLFRIWNKRSTLRIFLQVHKNQNKFPENKLVAGLSATNVCNISKSWMLHSCSICRIQDEDHLRGFRPPTTGSPLESTVGKNRRGIIERFVYRCVEMQQHPSQGGGTPGGTPAKPPMGFNLQIV